MRIFAGVRPVAVGIIAGYCFNLMKKQSRWWQWAISLGSIAAIALLKVSAFWVLLTLIVLSLAISLYRQKRRAEK